MKRKGKVRNKLRNVWPRAPRRNNGALGVPIQTSTELLPGRRPVDLAAALAVRPPPKSR